MTDRINDLISRMERAKSTSEAALKMCPKEERQNIIWIDCRIEFWLHSLREILVETEQSNHPV